MLFSDGPFSLLGMSFTWALSWVSILSPTAGLSGGKRVWHDQSKQK